MSLLGAIVGCVVLVFALAIVAACALRLAAGPRELGDDDGP